MSINISPLLSPHSEANKDADLDRIIADTKTREAAILAAELELNKENPTIH